MSEADPAFYFNGVRLPPGAACWSAAGLGGFLDDSENWDDDFSHREVWIVSCRIDHTGKVESADPGQFRYVIHEVLLLLLNRRPEALQHLSADFTDAAAAFDALVHGALEMLRLTKQEQAAFWTSGTEDDRERCVAWMNDSRRSPDDPQFRVPPHLRHAEQTLAALIGRQRKQLHALAQSGKFDKPLRVGLMQL